MKVRKFFYVCAPRGRVMHIQRTRYHPAGRTACGRVSTPDWLWQTGWVWVWQTRGRTPRCKQCVRAGER